MSIDALLYWVGMAAVAVNALTGVLDSGRKQMDLIGALLVAVATALGGGTVRDLLLDRNVFWVADQTYLIAALGTRPEQVARYADRQRDWQAQIAADVADPLLAHIVRLAVDGIWMNEAFGIEPLDPVTRTAVIERLLTLTRETSLPAQGKD